MEGRNYMEEKSVKNALARCHSICVTKIWLCEKKYIYRYMVLLGVRKSCGRKYLGLGTVIFCFVAGSLSWERWVKWNPLQWWYWRKIISYRTAVLFQALILGSFCVPGNRILTCSILNPCNNKHCYYLPPLPGLPNAVGTILQDCETASVQTEVSELSSKIPSLIMKNSWQ